MLNKEVLNSLMDKQAGLCLSLYMPSHRTGPQMRQDPIRMKNLLRQAEKQMQEMRLKDEEIKTKMKPAWKLVEQDSFWLNPKDGIALFMSEEICTSYRLPINFPEVVYVSERFHLKPLLRFLTSDGRYFVLALSPQQIRLYEGSRYNIHEINVEGMPHLMTEALGKDEFENNLQMRSSVGKAGIYHGHGNETEANKERLLRFFKIINTHLHPMLVNEDVPLVLAGVEYLHSIYREANTYKLLLDEGIYGSAERLTLEFLRQQAWAIVHPHYRQEREKAAAVYQELVGTGRTTNRVSEVIPASAQGRLDTLFVPVGEQSWGIFNQDTNELEIHQSEKPGDEDLLDLAAMQTLATGGKVFAVLPDQMPAQAPIAAIYRY